MISASLLFLAFKKWSEQGNNQDMDCFIVLFSDGSGQVRDGNERVRFSFNNFEEALNLFQTFGGIEPPPYTMGYEDGFAAGKENAFPSPEKLREQILRDPDDAVCENGLVRAGGAEPSEGDPLAEILGLRAMVKRLEAELIRRGADWATIGEIERGDQ